MVTKWKSKWKPTYNFIVWLFLLCFGINSIVVGVTNGDRYFRQSYFDTNEFASDISSFIDSLYAYKINPNEEIAITQGDIEEYRNRFGSLSFQLDNIRGQYEEKINEAKENDDEELATFFTNERDEKLADIRKNFTDDNHVIEKIKNERTAQLNETKEGERENYRFHSKSLSYYLTDTETNKTYTNMNVTTALEIDELFPKEDILFNGKIEQINTWDNRLTGTIIIPTGTVFQEYADNFQVNQGIYYSILMLGLISLVASWSLYRKAQGDGKVIYTKWKEAYYSAPIDIRILGFTFSTIAYLTFIVFWEQASFYLITFSIGEALEFIFLIILGVLLVGAIGLQGKWLIADFKNWDEHKQKWQQSIVWRFVQSMQKVFENRSVAMKCMFVCIVMVASGFGIPVALIGINWAGGVSLLLYIVLFILITIPTFIYAVRRLAYFNRITNTFAKITHGEVVPDLKTKGTSTLATLASNINTIKEEIKFTKKEQVKSERLKTELITNVSHDLRTPLTSIITYADLLKQEGISNDERNSYVEIINRKSKRLKMLIDDLFEVSKMASGNMILQKEKVDIVQLLQQSLAEYDEKIVQSSLQFRITHETKPIYAMVDGPKIWRVFDNVINNALKYSLEHTRVYITTEETEGDVLITFKNISKYELGENVEELFQRFKRGDTSRHTEGSGLGLAIGQSIIDLHGGSLQLDIDGDLFKVTITIPK